MATFKNPANGHIEEASGALSWLWALLFAWLYFVCRGNMKAGVIVFFLDGIFFASTFFVIGLILWPGFRIALAILTSKINDKYYLHNGWVMVGAHEQVTAKSDKEDKSE